ncbi:DNA invertase Pin-like site-specific DNA recombinase [Paraburkholderia graminis]|nr:DNA invertase Pin-like site-specific DNA recombinase [Paraburkholderia graminis]
MSLDHIDDTVVAQAPSVQAAEYVRMSTEHQQYSTENQRDRIREYAVRRGLEIVRTYADEGKSGLRIDGRQALQQLIKDVESGRADFQVILVYDVSRWGRFQDADESAYYEYVCRRVGIQVAYCAEQFENDGSPVSTIVKGVKRAMAGEYSRELSAKVFAGQCRLIELGFRQGGPAGYGLRRVLIDQHGIMKGELQRGEHKSLQTDRVILMPGPESEVRIINLIYNWFIDGSLNEYEIAARLNGMRVRTHLDREWTRATVREVLTNEKYIGNNVYNRVSFKLKKCASSILRTCGSERKVHSSLSYQVRRFTLHRASCGRAPGAIQMRSSSSVCATFTATAVSCPALLSTKLMACHQAPFICTGSAA